MSAALAGSAMFAAILLKAFFDQFSVGDSQIVFTEDHKNRPAIGFDMMSNLSPIAAIPMLGEPDVAMASSFHLLPSQ